MDVRVSTPTSLQWNWASPSLHHIHTMDMAASKQAKFFDHLVSLIPPKYYFDDDKEKLNLQFMKKAERQAAKQQFKEQAKTNKKQKLDPDAPASSLEVQKLQLNPKAKQVDAPKDGEASTAGRPPPLQQQLQQPHGGGAGHALNIAGGNVSREELRMKLHQKIEVSQPPAGQAGGRAGGLMVTHRRRALPCRLMHEGAPSSCICERRPRSIMHAWAGYSLCPPRVGTANHHFRLPPSPSAPPPLHALAMAALPCPPHAPLPSMHRAPSPPTPPCTLVAPPSTLSLAPPLPPGPLHSIITPPTTTSLPPSSLPPPLSLPCPPPPLHSLITAPSPLSSLPPPPSHRFPLPLSSLPPPPCRP